MQKLTLPTHCPRKHWQSCKTAALSAKAPTLQGFQNCTLAGKSCNTKAARLVKRCKTAHLPKFQHCRLPSSLPWPGCAKPQASSSNSRTWQGCKTATLQGFANCNPYQPAKALPKQTTDLARCKIANLQGSNTVGPAPTLQDFPSKSAKLQGPGKLAKLQTCKGSNTAGFQNYSPCQPCQPAKVSTLQASHLLQGLPNYKYSSKIQTARFQHCRHTQLQGFSSLPSSLLNCRARLQTTTSC